MLRSFLARHELLQSVYCFLATLVQFVEAFTEGVSGRRGSILGCSLCFLVRLSGRLGDFISRLGDWLRDAAAIISNGVSEQWEDQKDGQQSEEGGLHCQRFDDFWKKVWRYCSVWWGKVNELLQSGWSLLNSKHAKANWLVTLPSGASARNASLVGRLETSGIDWKLELATADVNKDHHHSSTTRMLHFLAVLQVYLGDSGQLCPDDDHRHCKKNIERMIIDSRQVN